MDHIRGDLTSMDLLDRSINDFVWSVRCFNCFKKAQILTLRDLTSRSETELLRIKFFGRKSLTEIKEVLAGIGLNLRDDDDDASLVGARR